MSSSVQPPLSDTEVIIKPSTTWFTIDWRGLVAYRDLIRQLVLRDFTAKYKQTILGPTWFFVNPLITTLMFTLVFNKVLNVSTDNVPPMLFYICGMLGWSYFAAVLGATGNSLGGNAGLFSKVYFPRLIPPLALTVSSLLALGIQLLTFLGFYIRTHWFTDNAVVQAPGFHWLLYPLIVLHMGVLALGVGLILSTLTAKYRDLNHIQGFLVQLWMYATPIVYPLSQVPDKWRWLYILNPMSAVVETFRYAFLGSGSIQLGQLAVSAVVTILVLGLGIVMFSRVEKSFMDTV